MTLEKDASWINSLFEYADLATGTGAPPADCPDSADEVACHRTTKAWVLGAAPLHHQPASISESLPMGSGYVSRQCSSRIRSRLLTRTIIWMVRIPSLAD